MNINSITFNQTGKDRHTNNDTDGQNTKKTLKLFTCVGRRSLMTYNNHSIHKPTHPPTHILKFFFSKWLPSKISHLIIATRSMTTKSQNLNFVA